MLDAARELTTWLDALSFPAGTLVGIVVLVRWMRSGELRNPLAGYPDRFGGAGLTAFAGLFLLYMLLSITAREVGNRWYGPPSETGGALPAGWQVRALLEDAVKLAVALVAWTLILRSPRPMTAPPRYSAARLCGTAILATLAILPLAYVQLQFCELLWRWVEPQAEPPMHFVLLILRDGGNVPLAAAQLVVSAVIIAPLLEEALFRGLLITGLLRGLDSPWLALALSSAAFGLVHVQQPQVVLPLATLGLLLGYLRVRYGSLWTCALVHALFNARTMVLALLFPELLEDAG